jgi:SAM-dependent methyltransferase
MLPTGPIGLRTPAPAPDTDTDTDPGVLLERWLLQAVEQDTSLHPRLLRLADGRLVPLEVDRWAGPVTDADLALLDRAAGPVLDVGCGPGRLTAALHNRGVPVLGLDVLEPVPVLARAAGAPVHVGDVFAPVPSEGSWRTVVVADGNVGIGGDPVRLLRRLRAVLADGGTVLVELHPGRSHAPARVRLEGLGTTSAWFSWALLGPDALPGAAAAAGLAVQERWTAQGREFAALRR